jgi:hypothetical protein
VNGSSWEVTVDPETWLAALADRLPTAPVSGPGVPTLGDAEREALLDLARVAAHTSERWTAPLSTYLAGAALAGSAPEDRVAAIRALVTDLEAAGPAT